MHLLQNVFSSKDKSCNIRTKLNSFLGFLFFYFNILNQSNNFYNELVLGLKKWRKELVKILFMIIFITFLFFASSSNICNVFHWEMILNKKPINFEIYFSQISPSVAPDTGIKKVVCWIVVKFFFIDMVMPK